MLLIALQLLNLCLQLVNQNLLLVQFLLHLLHSFQFVHSYVSRLPLFSDLSLEVLLRFLFLLLLRYDENLALRDFFLELTHFILRDDQLAVRLTSTLLQLVYMRLQLLYYISQLLVFFRELRLHTLKTHFVRLGVL